MLNFQLHADFANFRKSCCLIGPKLIKYDYDLWSAVTVMARNVFLFKKYFPTCMFICLVSHFFCFNYMEATFLKTSFSLPFSKQRQSNVKYGALDIWSSLPIYTMGIWLISNTFYIQFFIVYLVCWCLRFPCLVICLLHFLLFCYVTL